MSHKIMNYLERWEGNYVHFNKGEKDITSAYGIYKYAFPKADIFKWYEQISKRHNIPTDLKNKSNRKELILLIRNTPFYAEIERDLAWDFYSKHFISHSVVNILDKKSALTYFSISVNGGKKRGAKALQYALSRWDSNIEIDGKIGFKTLSALRKISSKSYHSPQQFNLYMIAYMRDFYKRLINKNPKRYKRYAQGWSNRMDGLV